VDFALFRADLDWAVPRSCIDRRHRLIRSWAATDASRHDGALLPALIDKDNTASDVWADTAYRSKANEKHLANTGLRSQTHRKKPRGKPMARRTARANGRKSAVRGGRARLCPAGGPEGPLYPHHRPCPGENQDRPGRPLTGDFFATIQASRAIRCSCPRTRQVTRVRSFPIL